MEYIIDFMDNFYIHMDPFVRRYPLGLPIRDIGHISCKTDWVRTTFDTFNFSFILSGRGEFRFEGRSWPVEAPCVITQWPGHYQEYGPEKTWEELYLIYRREYFPLLEKRNFANPQHPIWYVHEAGLLQRRLLELAELAKELNAPGRVDEIDRHCERWILESLISETRPSLSPQDQNIQLVRAYVEEHFAETLDFDRLAKKNKMSPATFRRHWEKNVHMPPGVYVSHLRMQKACRLLAETSLPVGDIARAVGYEDVLYFSRRFHNSVGLTASGYRRQNHARLHLESR